MRPTKTFAILLAGMAVMSSATSALPCSVFTAHDDKTVLAGNNEDWYGGEANLIWFVPPESAKNGYVAYGWASNRFSQGGMNDQGLFWDGLATPTVVCKQCSGPDPFTLTSLEEILQDSDTVQEAIDNLLKYDSAEVLESAQLIFADANGDSAIFEGDEIIWPQYDYQIATNFLQSNPDLGNYPCWRYDTLETLMQAGPELTVDYFRQMADAVHQGSAPGSGVYTRYTTVGDLKKGELYLFRDLDYSRCVRFDLAEELSQPAHEYLMETLTYQPNCWDAGGGGSGGSAGAAGAAGAAGSSGTGGDAGAGAEGGTAGAGGSTPSGGSAGAAGNANIDAGVGGTNAAPDVEPGEDDTGCGCRVQGRSSQGGAAWLLALMAALAVSIRRRGRRFSCSLPT
jgi:MYXO-CTERM domain-containing protein